MGLGYLEPCLGRVMPGGGGLRCRVPRLSLGLKGGLVLRLLGGTGLREVAGLGGGMTSGFRWGLGCGL